MSASEHNQQPYIPKIKCLDGIRCLCCFWILFLHANAFSANIPYTEPSMKYIREFPIIGFLATSTLAVDAFWILSGFLCEYQLLFKVDRNKSFWPLWFMLNRLLRLYPLYLLNTFMNYASQITITCDSLWSVFKSITFVEVFWGDEKYGIPACSGAAWTVHTDVHGYIAIIVLCMLLGDNIRTKKYIYWFLFIISCSWTAFFIYKEDISWPIMIIGLQNQNSSDLNQIYEDNPALKEQWPNVIELYNKINPEYDINTPQLIAYRARNMQWFREVYITSIARHGACIFLGAILALNVVKNGKNVGWMKCMMKCMVFGVAVYLANDLIQDTNYRPWYWTFAYDKLTAVAIWVLFDVIISLSQSDGAISNVIHALFANKLWRYGAKFTYGIYLYHSVVLFVVLSPTICDLDNGGIGPENFGFLYLAKICACALGGSLLISVIMHYLMEYPSSLFRYKYIRPKYVKTTKEKDY